MIRGQVSLERSLVNSITKDQRAVELIMLAQEQLLSMVQQIRLDDLDDQTVFPGIPEDGYGMLYTPWGVYSASDGGVWLRLHTGATYAVGDSIPTTL